MKLKDRIAETKGEITAFKKSQGIGTAGKGSCPRNNFSRAFRENFDAIRWGRSPKRSPLTRGGGK
jgi:hypothetical protein